MIVSYFFQYTCKWLHTIVKHVQRNHTKSSLYPACFALNYLRRKQATSFSPKIYRRNSSEYILVAWISASEFFLCPNPNPFCCPFTLFLYFDLRGQKQTTIHSSPTQHPLDSTVLINSSLFIHEGRVVVTLIIKTACAWIGLISG